jgi:small-conductance mechanosensitive channel
MTVEDIILDFYRAILGGKIANLIVAVIVLLLGFIIGKVAGRVVKRLLHEIDFDKNLKKAGVRLSLEKFVSSSVSYFIYFIAIISALNQFGVVTPVFTILLIGLVFFVAAGVLLAVRDFVPNFFSGFYIFRTNLIKQGDTIRVHNTIGVVEQITLTKTRIRTKSKELVFIPNSVIAKSEITKLIK